MIRKKADHLIETREKMRGGKGTVIAEHLEREALPENGRMFAKLTIAPGCSIGEHQHVGESELFYFANGSGVITDDGERLSVSAGDVMTTGDGHWHSVENTGDVDLELIAVIIKSPPAK